MNGPYRRLIRKDRLRPSSYDRTIAEEAQSDQARVLFSSPFRRLQNKAQVFALEPNAAVRSRLTHSLEVSSLGRLIALTVLRLFEIAGKRESLGLTDGYDDAFVTFAETACLLHDIGNPPFGHYGELALSEWFTRNEKDLKDNLFGRSSDGTAAVRWNREYRDFTEFDGNPQGLRIVARLQWHLDQYGLNLTATQLASMIKYPVSTAERDGSPWSKAGLFQTEEPVQRRVWEILGLGSGRRHPLVMIMEAADDIGYCMSDIEDALEKEVVSYNDFFDHMNGFLSRFPDAKEEVWISRLMSQLPDSPVGLMSLLGFRTTLARELTEICARHYVDSHDAILAGSDKSLLPESSIEFHLLDYLKEFAKQNIYGSRTVRDRELVAYSVISGLLDTYQPLLNCREEKFTATILAVTDECYEKYERPSIEARVVTEKPSIETKVVTQRPSIEATLLSRFPRKHLKAYCDQAKTLPTDNKIGTEREREVKEWMLRGRLIVDYISGMTDDFAFQMHNLTSGVRGYGSI